MAYNFRLGFKTNFVRQPAPRMYCDICEEFDLHETEDCPTQASDEPISSSQSGKDKKEKPPPRPYCEICGGKSPSLCYCLVFMVL